MSAEPRPNDPQNTGTRRSLLAMPRTNPRRGTGFRGALDDLLSTFPWSTTVLVFGILSTALSLGFGLGLGWREDTVTERFQALSDSERAYIELIGKTRDENERRLLQSELSATRAKLGKARRQMGLEDSPDGPGSRSGRTSVEGTRTDGTVARVPGSTSTRNETPSGAPEASPSTSTPYTPGNPDGRIAVTVPQESPRPTSPRELPPLDLDLSPYLGPDPPAPADSDPAPEDDTRVLLSSTWGFAQHTRLTLVAPPGLDDHHAELTGALMRSFPPRAGTFDLPR